MRAILLISFAAVALAACDKEVSYTPPTNEVVVHNESEECPRADGAPCR